MTKTKKTTEEWRSYYRNRASKRRAQGWHLYTAWVPNTALEMLKAYRAKLAEEYAPRKSS